MAEIPSGVFDVTGSKSPWIEQIGGIPVDPDTFTKLGLILIQAKLDGAKPKDIVEKVAPHSLNLARRLNAVADDPQAFAAVLVAVIGAIAAITVSALSSTPEAKPTDIHIHIDSSTGDFERQRDNLQRMREQGTPLPQWSSNILQPYNSRSNSDSA